MAIGQFFSQRFGYAVHALAYIAKKPSGRLTTLPEVAEWMRTVWPSSSDTYLSNVIQRLARGGLLRSHRGVTGGYSLARAGDKITLRDVVELLEGVQVSRCGLSLEDNCPVGKRCTIQRKLRGLEEGYLDSLAQISILELSGDITIPHRLSKAWS
jgi:Rrf2 family protein